MLWLLCLRFGFSLSQDLMYVDLELLILDSPPPPLCLLWLDFSGKVSVGFDELVILGLYLPGRPLSKSSDFSFAFISERP